jgi:maltose alpha-D-glucosyltransferase/alpha-amylase
LFTGKDFQFSDLEHVLGRSHAARRIKQSALCDVAGLMYSLHTIAVKTVPKIAQFGVYTPQATTVLRHALEKWFRWSASALLKGYLSGNRPTSLGRGRPSDKARDSSSLIPEDATERDILLRFYLLERALSELSDVLTRRPESAAVRIGGALELLAM